MEAVGQDDAAYDAAAAATAAAAAAAVESSEAEQMPGEEEAPAVLEAPAQTTNQSNVLKLKGLPYTCSVEAVQVSAEGRASTHARPAA